MLWIALGIVVPSSWTLALSLAVMAKRADEEREQ